MKLITDEQYVAINQIIKELNLFHGAKDERGQSMLEYYKDIETTLHNEAYYDGAIETMINICEKSLKGEEWAAEYCVCISAEHGVPPSMCKCIFCKDMSDDDHNE